MEEEMQKFLGEIPLSALTEFCQQVFATFNFHPNNYFMQNFILHLIIALNQQKQTSEREFSSPSLPMIEQISGWVFENYGLELFFEDKCELALLCDGERGHGLPEVKNYVNKEVAQSLNQALKELSDVFLIDFTDQQFLMRLLLHTQNLYNRVKGKKVKRNLSALDIKVRYPALFDIAVYLSSLISTDLKIEIAEDEIAFLALHLGSFLDDQKKNANKIRTKLKISNYLDRKERVQEILEERFGEELFFIATDKAVSEDGLELILSSEKVVADEVLETVYIHDFLTERDFIHIRDGIERVKRKQYVQFLSTLLPKLIQEEAYVNDIKIESKAEIFKFIGQWFFENNFESKDYHQKLLEREKMSATSFSSGVAIPHTIKYEGEKTGLLILNPKDDFHWGEQSIGLVVALAISPNDAQNFNRIFPRMIEILAEKYHVNYLKGSQNRNEFIHRLIEVMTGDGFYE